ncbi:MAG: hypothetical protein R2746_16100 [Acidimicrobiales bacterium]
MELLLSTDAVVLHRRFVAIRFTLAELARRTRIVGAPPAVFVSDLVDLVTGLLSARIDGDEGRGRRRRRARSAAGD